MKLLQEEVFSDRVLSESRPRTASDVLRLVESVTLSLEKDVDRYSFRVRDLDNIRFATMVIIFVAYAIIAALVVRIVLDTDTDPSMVLGLAIPRGVVTYVALLFAGVPILVGLLGRSVQLRKSLKLIRRNLDVKIEFAEQVLTRASTWEARFKGDYYQKSILKLRITVLAQLIDEMRSISTSRLSAGAVSEAIHSAFRR